MGKTVRKFIKGKEYDIGSRESWLRDMAKEGFILKKMGTSLATFEIGGSIDTEYRIKGVIFTPEQCEEYGWEKVCVLEHQAIYRCKDIDNFTELPLYDLEYEPLFKRLRSNIWFSLFAFLFSLSMYLFGIFSISDNWVDRDLSFILFSVMVVSIIINWTVWRKDFIRIKAFKQNTSVDHHKDWREAEKYKKLPIFVLICAAAICTAIVLATNSPTQTFALEEYNNDRQVKVLRLSDIEGVSEHNKKEDNFISFSSNVFVSEKYILEEDEEGHAENSYLKIEYYELRAKVISYILQRNYTGYWLEHPEETYELSSKYFDYIRVFENGHRINFFIRNDNIVMFIEYRGEKTAELLLEAIEKKYADDWQEGMKNP